MKGATREIIVLLCCIAVASCDVDLRAILDRAAHKLASQLGTTLNHYKLNNGICVSQQDGGDQSGCISQPEGEWAETAPGLDLIESNRTN